MGAAVCMDDGPGYAVSTNDIVATPGHAMSTEDASGVTSPIYPITDTPAYAEDSSGHTVSTYDVAAMLGHATPTMGALDVPSTTCPPIDAAIDCASLVDPAVTLMMLPPASVAALDESWRAH